MGGPFKIVLASVERRVGPEVLGNPTAERIVRELGRMFDLDRDTAGSIVSATPIVIVDGLDGYSAHVVRDRLRVLVDLGCKLTVTDEVTDTMPRIDWPALPPIARVDPPHAHGHAGRNGSGGSGLQCPGCGLLLQLVRSDGAAPRAEGPPIEARGGAGAAGGAASRALTGGGAVERDASPPPSKAPNPLKTPPPTSEDEDADWLAPPVPPPTSSPAGRKPPTGASDARLRRDATPEPMRRPAPAPAPAPRPSPAQSEASGRGRFDDPALLRPGPGQGPAPAKGQAGLATPRAAPETELKVAFTEPSDEGQVPPPSGLGELDEELDSAPAARSADPFELLEDAPPVENLEERRSHKKRSSGADLFGEASSRGSGPPKEQLFASASPFEESGNIESMKDSASDLLGPPPAKAKRGAASKPVKEEESAFDLLSSDEPPPPSRRGGAQGLDSPAADLGKSDSLDDLLVDDEPPTQPRQKERDKGKGRGKPEPEKGRGRPGASHPELPDLQSSKDPELDEVLRLFGPEDEEPLDDGLGLDPAPPDLGPPRDKRRPPSSEVGSKKARTNGGSGAGSGRRSQPFGGEMSDILEPLDPDEAIKIMKGQKPPAVRSGRSSTASNIRLDESAEPGPSSGSAGGTSGLEPLDPSEAFAILAADNVKDPRSARKKSRGVPYPATDEDVSLFEESSSPRRPAPAPAAKKAKTDPFARARKQIEEDEEASKKPEKPPRQSDRADRAANDRSERHKSGARKRPPPPPPSNAGDDGEHGLVLSRISDPDKKEQAAELIVQIKGCSIDDARRLTDRTIIPVLKGVSRELAEHHLERFKEIDIAGRVTTRQRG